MGIVFISNLLKSILIFAIGMIITRFIVARATQSVLTRVFNSVNLLGGNILLTLYSTIAYIINTYNVHPDNPGVYAYGKLTTTALIIIYLVFGMNLIIKKSSKAGFRMIKIYSWVEIVLAVFNCYAANILKEPYKSNYYSSALFQFVFAVILLNILSRETKKQAPEENKILFTEQ